MGLIWNGNIKYWQTNLCLASTGSRDRKKSETQPSKSIKFTEEKEPGQSFAVFEKDRNQEDRSSRTDNFIHRIRIGLKTPYK